MMFVMIEPLHEFLHIVLYPCRWRYRILATTDKYWNGSIVSCFFTVYLLIEQAVQLKDIRFLQWFARSECMNIVVSMRMSNGFIHIAEWFSFNRQTIFYHDLCL